MMRRAEVDVGEEGAVVLGPFAVIVKAGRQWDTSTFLPFTSFISCQLSTARPFLSLNAL